MPPKPTNTEDRVPDAAVDLALDACVSHPDVDIAPEQESAYRENWSPIVAAELAAALPSLEASFKERVLGDQAKGAIVDFLDAWRFCPVSEASNPSRACLEDAADQLLAALKPNGAEEVGDGVGAGQPAGGEGKSEQAALPAATPSVDSVTTEQGAEGKEQVEAESALRQGIEATQREFLRRSELWPRNIAWAFGEAADSLTDLLASTQPSSETTTNPQSREAASAAPEGADR